MTSRWCYIPNMKALGLVVSDKKIFENCILKTYFLTLWPNYATNWNGLNNFDRGPPRDHSCEVWSKSNKQFQRRCCLKKLLTDGRTHGRRTPDIEGSQKLTEHFVLRWAKNAIFISEILFRFSVEYTHPNFQRPHFQFDTVWLIDHVKLWNFITIYFNKASLKFFLKFCNLESFGDIMTSHVILTLRHYASHRCSK